MVLLFFPGSEDLAVELVDPAVQPIKRLDGSREVDCHTQVAQPAETGRDVEGDVIVRRAAGKPRPRPVAQLLLGELLQQPGGFVVQPIVVEENAHILPT